MRRHRLSGKEVKAINDELLSLYALPDFLDKQDNIELFDDTYLSINGEISFFYHEGAIVPTLRLILKRDFLKKAVIDMPAVRFIANGADVMRPGIREMEGFKLGDIIGVVDEKNHKPLAIGKALFSSEDMAKLDKGKAIQNLHHVGDKIWTSEVLQRDKDPAGAKAF